MVTTVMDPNWPLSHGGHVKSRGIENFFCFAPPKLDPKHFNSRLGIRNLCRANKPHSRPTTQTRHLITILLSLLVSNANKQEKKEIC